jgi:UDP-N-acetylglucosamine:LPS N-acetylglucosamine transferase
MRASGQPSGSLKICVAASSGGHLVQLLGLGPSWQQYETIYVTTDDGIAGELNRTGRVYTVTDCNRRRLLRVAKAFFKCAKIAMSERPDVVISTGAAPGLLMCVLGKITGAKVIWIDSITNTQRLSLSGRLVRPFADLLLTQWQELADRYRKIEYAGQVI